LALGSGKAEKQGRCRATFSRFRADICRFSGLSAAADEVSYAKNGENWQEMITSQLIGLILKSFIP
jgi:hypothetical protein